MQQLKKAQTTSESSFTSMEAWNIRWPNMPDTTPYVRNP